MKTLKTPFALAVLLALGSGGAALAAEEMGTGAHRTDATGETAGDTAGGITGTMTEHQSEVLSGDQGMAQDDMAAGENQFGARWEDFDTDQDDYISRSEAETNPDLTNRWSDLDANQDDMLDSDEFSRFEEEMQGSGAMGGDTGMGTGTDTMGNTDQMQDSGGMSGSGMSGGTGMGSDATTQ